MRCGVVAVVVAALAACAPAAVFQYAVPVETQRGQAAAFLWIPPRAQQVRGVVMGGMTLMEREFAKDPVIREACAAEGLAIVFLKCGLGAVDVQKVLDDLAAASGYRELSAAPLMFVGHSAGGPPAKELAVKMAARCFGVVQYRGGGPWGGQPVPPGVPALMMVAQFDEFGGLMRDANGYERAWEGARNGLAAFRAEDPRRLASIVVEPGAGHFAWSDRNAAYLALWIRKAAAARIPPWPADAARPPALRDIDPNSGWLTDLTIRTAGEHAPAAYAKYTGDKGRANWHFDRQLAEATVAYHAGFGRKDQFIRWKDPYWVDAGTRYFFTNLKWIGDGQTFEVHPVYADTYPRPQKSGGPRWADAGKPVGHSSAPIRLKHASGPVVAVGNTGLRMCYDGLAPASEGSRVTFMAYSVGDAEYRYTEQVGMMPRGFGGLRGGKEQTISFPPVGKLTVGGPPAELKAVSDAGLPVEYYVAVGPAAVVAGKLAIADLPARAKFPVTVKVVAWQFGRGCAPLVKTAAPVEQTVLIEKP